MSVRLSDMSYDSLLDPAAADRIMVLQQVRAKRTSERLKDRARDPVAALADRYLAVLVANHFDGFFASASHNFRACSRITNALPSI